MGSEDIRINSNGPSNSFATPSTVPPQNVNIRKLYEKREFLKFPELRRLLKDALSRKKISAIPSNLLVAEKKTIRRRASHCFKCMTWKLKLMRPGFRKRFDAAVNEVANAYFDSQKRAQKSSLKPKEIIPSKSTPQEDPHKETRIKIETLAWELETLNQQIQTKNDAVVENHKNQKTDCSLIDGDAYKDARDVYLDHKSQLEKLKKDLTQAEAYRDSTLGYCYSFISSSPQCEVERINKEIKELEEILACEKIAYDHLEVLVTEQKSKLEKYRAEEKLLSEEVDSLVSKRVLLTAERGELSRKFTQATGVQIDQLTSETPVQTPLSSIKQVKLNFGTPEANYQYVKEHIEKSIDACPGSPEVKAANLRRTLGYLKKPTKTRVLQMSGIPQEDLVMKKSAMAVRILSLALTEETNNERLVNVVVAFLDSLLSLNTRVNKQDKENIGNLLKFAFEIDPATQVPRMDEAYRFRGLSIIMGCVLILSHYFFDEESLKPEIRIIRKILHTPFLGKALLSGAYYLKKEELVNSIREVPIFEAKHREDVNNLVEVLEPVITEVLGRGNSDMKKRIMNATKIFADQDFITFMDLIDFDNLPTTTELTEACATLFERFIKNLENN